MSAFGKFPSLEAFLVAHEAERRTAGRAEDVDLSSTARMTPRRKDRDVVEVDCTIVEVEPSDTRGSKHILLEVELTAVLASDVDVDDDVRRHLASHAYVLVSIQYDAHHRQIPGLVQGVAIRVRGAWITADQAYAVGGERL